MNMWLDTSACERTLRYIFDKSPISPSTFLHCVISLSIYGWKVPVDIEYAPCDFTIDDSGTIVGLQANNNLLNASIPINASFLSSLNALKEKIESVKD